MKPTRTTLGLLLSISCVVGEGHGLQASAPAAVVKKHRLSSIDPVLMRFLVALGRQPEAITHIIFGYAPELLSKNKLCTLEHTELTAIAPLCIFSEDASTVFTATFNGCCTDTSQPGCYYRSSYSYAHCARTGKIITEDGFSYGKTHTIPISSDTYPMDVTWDMKEHALATNFCFLVLNKNKNKCLDHPFLEEQKSFKAIKKPLQVKIIPPRLVCSSDNNRLAIVSDSGDEEGRVHVWELTSKEVAYQVYARIAKEEALRQQEECLKQATKCHMLHYMGCCIQ